MNPDWIVNYMAKVESNIQQHGWHVQHVLPGEGPEDFPYSYTVGLAEKGWPELILTQLHPQNAQMILNAVVQRLRKLNEEPKPDMLVDKALNLPMKIASVSDVEIEERLRIATYRAGILDLDPSAVHGLQVVWPDTAGNFPGDPDYDAEHFPQPMLDSVWAKAPATSEKSQQES